MSSKPQQDSGGSQKANASENAAPQSRLPFEPSQNRKKPAKKSAPVVKAEAASVDKTQPAAGQSAPVPEVVSRRMARRMGFFCGIPTSLGMLTFVVSYIIVTQHWFKVPNAAVVLVSMGFFGLGVLGLTYGVLSASWDEDQAGSLIGWNEFSVNLGRLVESWRSARQKPDS